MQKSLVFVVSVLDCAYNPPRLSIKYAGDDMSLANKTYQKFVSCSDRMNITLDLVQNHETKRLESFDCDNFVIQ